MNLELPEKEKISKNRIIIYIIIALICIISIVVVIGVQILGNDVIDNLFGINKITKRSEEEEAVLKNNFENIFDNSLENDEEYQIQKINNNENIIYTSYTKEDKKDNYEINVNLPYINIENKEVKQFNKEIKDTFEGKAEETIKNKNNNNIIYTVKYKAYIENNNLSLIIYSDLKQSTSAQRVIIQTFNYDLKENKENKLEDTLNNYSLKINDVQNKINNDIQKEQKKSEELIKLGYNVFSRDINSDIYKIDNITEYFVYKNNIYIIFAYGNNKITSEKDIVII
ncbi:unknown [Clostridium sp. CAG:389]|nr:unknown [Clostridium sp. CAG:389]